MRHTRVLSRASPGEMTHRATVRSGQSSRGVWSCRRTRVIKTHRTLGSGRASTPGSCGRNSSTSTCQTQKREGWISGGRAELKTQRLVAQLMAEGKSAPDPAGALGSHSRSRGTATRAETTGKAHPRRIRPSGIACKKADQVQRLAGEGSGKRGFHSRRPNPMLAENAKLACLTRLFQSALGTSQK